jgi:hypothetical protein
LAFFPSFHYPGVKVFLFGGGEMEKLDKQDFIKLLDIANQRIRHHHDALWKEETHYTWLVYILAAGVIYIFFISGVSWPLKAGIAILLSVIGICVCLIGYSVVRKEGRYFHEAIQIRNRLNRAIGLDKRIKIELDFDEMLLPRKDTEIKNWHEVRCKANKPLKELLGGLFKWDSMVIRDWFQITLLFPILIFVIMIVLSIIKVCSA